ncbi:restriction endonuclease subunit S [Enterococcus sp. DIV0436a]|uniref:restriction endonuclease subunit S n=1 Tax=Enterococcus sp. DIV0436a TaxID=2774918 RepID=UPI002E99EF8A|nr:restriction endonuclease subunit S [Enterococcus faecium]
MINTKALREKILDLAMRGKLVVPDLTKEKTDIFETEKQGYLPQNWVLTSLSNVATLLNGRAYKKNELLSNERLTPVLRVGNLFTNSQWYYSDLNLDSNKYIDNGDLIYAWSASFGPRIWNGGKAIYHYHIWKISLRFEESKKFMYYFLLDNAKKVKKNTTGSTMVHITKRKMEQMKVPFPPLEEQKRIVAKIEELFALIDIIESNQLEFKQLAEQLDKKVLDLAMRGKLVPQNPTDEPASVLLDEIKEEKEQLIKDKKVKKEKPLPEISKEEIPYEIPDSWEWVRLVDIGSIFSGGTPKTTINEFWEKGTIPWITPAIMGKSKSKIFNSVALKHITEQGLNASSAQLIPGSSIVYSSRAPIGHINIVPYPYSTNQGCKSVTPIKVDVDYLYYCLVFRTPDIKKRASGTTFKEISGKGFSMTVVSIPPLAEQKRIVAKIEMIRESIQRIDFE